MTAAFINGTTFKVGDAASPEVFTTIGEMVELDGLGKTNPLVDVTSFDSTAKEYIAGLADGDEITVECIYLPANTQQQALVTHVDNGTNVNIQVLITDGTTPKTYAFAAIALSWKINPNSEDKNMINFTLKITGAITVS